MYITGYNSYSMYNDTIYKKNYFIDELNERGEYILKLVIIYKKNYNTYLNIHFFYQDISITKFINTLLISQVISLPAGDYQPPITTIFIRGQLFQGLMWGMQP